MRKFLLLLCLILLVSHSSSAQVLSNKSEYTRAETLRGSLRPERDYDVLKYHLQLKVEPEKKYISGSNTITFKVQEGLAEEGVMQVDLFDNMKIDSIIFNGNALDYNREFNAVFLEFEQPLKENAVDSIQFYYSGNPIVAKNAPWDGGFVFAKDQQGDSFIATAVQGTGASLWYPNKDHQSDEPEEALIEVAVPKGLMDVSNGRLVAKKDLGNGFTQWSWKVESPINNYDIALNIANYAHFQDKYKDLDLNYYVLPENLEKAKKQFQEVKLMMDCFYKKLGEYPFEKDGFKLVETPYLGMEHQSAVAYGNHYQNGYLGRDRSATGIGMKWDFIIIHESGHEWFGNSITAKDIADMWLHEGFTTYAESVYIECRWGKEEALDYLFGLRRLIENESPIIGDYGVNTEGSSDMYDKGANIINTLRSIYNDDELWWKTLKDYTETFRHQTITTSQAENFFDAATDYHLEAFFDQYLRKSKIPVLELKNEGSTVAFRWDADVQNFSMPVDVKINGKEIRLNPTENWQKLEQENVDLEDVELMKKEFYVDVEFLK